MLVWFVRDRERAIKFYSRAYELGFLAGDIIRRLEIANEPIRLIAENTNHKEILESTTQQVVVDEIDQISENDLAIRNDHCGAYSENSRNA